MKSTLRTLSALLAALAVLSAAACGESAEAPAQGQASDQTAEAITSAETEAAETEATPEFDTADYGGAKFTVLYPGWGHFNDYFFTDEETGDQMNDAIYQRMVKTEEYLGVDLENVTPGYIETIAPTVQKAVMAGADDYQMVLTHCISGVADMMQSHLLYDFRQLPFVDLEGEYFNHQIDDLLSIGGRSYYEASEYMISDPNCYLFNTKMRESYGVPDLYDLVRTGKWTMDRNIEYASLVSVDVDGNGKFDENDQYGMTAEADWMLNSFYNAFGKYTVRKEGDTYVLDLGDDKTVDIFDKCFKLFRGGDYAFTWKYAADKTVKIDTGRCLFTIVPINSVKTLRESPVDFGILPYPKYDEAQEGYYSVNWSGLMCVPATVADPEMVGKVIQTLSVFSRDTVQSAYYDVLLTGKLARDEASVEMLHIIFDGVVYDPGMNYFGFNSSFQSLFYGIPNLINQNKNDFASLYAKNEKGATKAIEKFISKVLDEG